MKSNLLIVPILFHHNQLGVTLEVLFYKLVNKDAKLSDILIK